MKNWMWAYIYAVIILIASCMIAIVYHMNEMSMALEDMREELLIMRTECVQLKEDVARWERLNESSIILLNKGGWEWLRQ